MDLNPHFVDQLHCRLNALTNERFFVSPHRTKRPWQGRVEPAASANRPGYAPQCYVCPGNVRANQELNPEYDSALVFTSDFAAFLADTPDADASRHPLLRAHMQVGTCHVISLSPRHDLTLAPMSAPDIRPVVDVWAEQVGELGKSGAGCRYLRTKATQWVARTRIRMDRSGQATLFPMKPIRN